MFKTHFLLLKFNELENQILPNFHLPQELLRVHFTHMRNTQKREHLLQIFNTFANRSVKMCRKNICFSFSKQENDAISVDQFMFLHIRVAFPCFTFFEIRRKIKPIVSLSMDKTFHTSTNLRRTFNSTIGFYFISM